MSGRNEQSVVPTSPKPVDTTSVYFHREVCLAGGIPIAFAFAVAIALQGCGSVTQAVVQAKTSVEAALAPSGSVSGPAARSSIAGTELVGIYKRYPLTGNAARDSYPRAAITIVSATPSIFRLGPALPDQCVGFSVRLWTDARTSKSFDGLQMCAADKLTGVPFQTLFYWRNQPIPIETTGAVRTDGPKRPKTNFPTEAKVANAWLGNANQAFYYLGNILYQMGYDWDQPGEYRAWVVSAPDH